MAELTLQQAIDEGLRHHRAGRLVEAQGAYNQVLSREPTNAAALHLLGVLANQVGNHSAAVDLIGRAVAVNPASAEMYNNLGVAVGDMGRADDALRCYQKAIQLRGNYPEPWANLGNVHMARHEVDLAMDCYKKAVELRPEFADAQVGLAAGYLRQGRVDEALRACAEAIKHAPDSPRAHWIKALALLTMGDWTQGFREYEWRFQLKEHRAAVPQFIQPRWDGSDPAGKTILAWCEPAVADIIMCLRYLPLLARRGARVVVLCPPDAQNLVATVEGVTAVVTPGAAGPPFDLHVPLGSLPLLMGTTLKSVPADVPYLRPPPASVQAWAAAIAEEAVGMKKVGLAWHDPSDRDPSRRLTLEDLAPWGLINGLRFVGLQRDMDPKNARVPWGMVVKIHPGSLTNPVETVALIANLDMVVTVDPAMAQLAGALAKPTYLLLPYATDWRWLRKRDDSPWYPTIKIFRQPTPGDWKPVVVALTRELKALTGP